MAGTGLSGTEKRFEKQKLLVAGLVVGGAELGAVIASGTAVANIADASTAHALNATFSDTEVEAALNALAAKINSIIAALEAFDIAASS